MVNAYSLRFTYQIQMAQSERLVGSLESPVQLDTSPKIPEVFVATVETQKPLKLDVESNGHSADTSKSHVDSTKPQSDSSKVNQTPPRDDSKKTLKIPAKASSLRHLTTSPTSEVPKLERSMSSPDHSKDVKLSSPKISRNKSSRSYDDDTDSDGEADTVPWPVFPSFLDHPVETCLLETLVYMLTGSKYSVSTASNIQHAVTVFWENEKKLR